MDLVTSVFCSLPKNYLVETTTLKILSNQLLLSEVDNPLL